MAILLKKMTTFVNFFEKKSQVFGNFLPFKWQFSGGSAWYFLSPVKPAEQLIFLHVKIRLRFWLFFTYISGKDLF